MESQKFFFVHFFSFLLFFSLLAFSAFAHGEEEFSLAEELIKEKVSCSQLSDEQLEIIGEYYMEQMHPGELHELMDERMGGEGSAQLKNVHIALAKNFYCGEHEMMSANMMNMMMGRTAGFGSTTETFKTTGFRGMMGSGFGAGMMGLGYGGVSLFGLLYLLLLIALIVLAVLWIVRLWKELGRKSKKIK